MQGRSRRRGIKVLRQKVLRISVSLIFLTATVPVSRAKQLEEPALDPHLVEDFLLVTPKTLQAIVVGPNNEPKPTPKPTAVPKPPVRAKIAQPKPLAQETEAWLREVGIPQEDWEYVNFIVRAEGGWRFNATNKSSGAYGICQSLPGDKMASAGTDWKTNPITQLRWCDSYAKARYGSWYKAMVFWKSAHWW